MSLVSYTIYLEGVYFLGRVFSYTISDHSTHIENSCHKTLYYLLQVKDEFSFLYYLFKYEKSEILIFKYEKTHSTHIENSCDKTLYYLFRRMSLVFYTIYLNMRKVKFSYLNMRKLILHI